MASALTSKNREYLFRLQILLIDGGNLVIRNIFNQKLASQNITLTSCLAQEKQTIGNLKTKKAITPKQYDLLFPQSGTPPSITDFDISLTICLLRNLKVFGLNRKYNWQSKPQSTDFSVEADITRLRTYRNEIAHISGTTDIQQNDFSSKWTEIEQMLLRLNFSVNNPVSDLQQQIYDFKTCSLDPKTEQRLHKEIDVWRELYKGADENIQRLQKEYRMLKEDVTAKKETETKRVKLEHIKEEDKYKNQKQALQEDLIKLFRKNFWTFDLSPLVNTEDTPLLTFYEKSEISVVTFHRGRDGGREVRRPVERFRNMFYKENKRFREIYLTADAGLGKTSISKRLVLTWCQAKDRDLDNDEHFSQEEIETMDEFDFVFLLLLRYSPLCDIDKMILDHIVSQLGRPIKLKDLRNIMFNERCLVILDGLDEWTHPSGYCKHGWSYIPHRKARDCTVLTTTRPWKMSDIKNSQIDQYLEIAGLSRESANALKKKVISYLFDEKDENELEKCVNNFTTAMQEKELTDLEAVPLLLMYLLCLSCENIKLGESHCELYSDIIELLLSRAVKRDKLKPILDNPAQNDIPQCFRTRTNCKKFYSLLASLARLAYRALFNETRENTLVFDSELAEECLDTELMKGCLAVGILSQRKVHGKLTKKEAKVSFAHKTIQEFFTALYMHTSPDKCTVQKRVISQCNSIKDILEMAKVFIFLGGINVDVLSLLSSELIEVINKDEITQQYRTMTFVFYDENYTKPLKKIQNMFISCVKENPQNANLKLFHQDIIIDKDCKKEKYYMYLQQLAVQNKENIKSVSVKMEGIPYSVQEIISSFRLTDFSCVEKIFYRGEFDNFDFIPLLQRSVKCLSLISHKWQDNHFVPKTSKQWSSSMSSKLYSLVNLEDIDIECFEMSHDELKKLVKYLLRRKSMREIVLYNISCMDHEDSCDGFSLDLSQHSQLGRLQISGIPLSELEINVASLEMCQVGRFSKPGLVSRFLSSLPAASKLHTCLCSELESTEDIEKMLATLHQLVHLKQVRLAGINLGDRKLSLSPEMVNCEYVLLYQVKMIASVFRDLVNQVQKLRQAVTVSIRECIVTPEEEFEKEKK